MIEGETQLLKVVLGPVHMLYGMHMPTHTHSALSLSTHTYTLVHEFGETQSSIIKIKHSDP